MSLVSVTEEENGFYTKIRLLKEALQHAKSTARGFAIFMKEGCGKEQQLFLPFKKCNMLVWGFFFLEQGFDVETLNFHGDALSGWRSALPLVKHFSFLAKTGKKHLQDRCALRCGGVGLAAVKRYT